ncbi:MAG TPA: hypothetical protein VIH27_04670 [Nitrososphaerales archaeon]
MSLMSPALDATRFRPLRSIDESTCPYRKNDAKVHLIFVEASHKGGGKDLNLASS